jgi:hypothetical protein
MRLLRGKLATTAHGCRPCFLFGNDTVTFPRNPQRLRKLITDYRSLDHCPAPPARTALNVPCFDGNAARERSTQDFTEGNKGNEDFAESESYSDTWLSLFPAV